MSKLTKKTSAILILITLTFISSVFAQKKIPKKKTAPKPHLISAGVVNGKAKNLVVPKFPQTARVTGIYGTIKVAVIIDEKGNVVEAKAISGHTFLKPNSIKAALQSEFIPITIGGNPVKVTGIIIYNYVPCSYNWLEIGYSIKKTIIWENMPSGFENEKEFFKIYQNADYKNEQTAFDNLIASIEGKLSNEEKDLWLFKVGSILRNMQNHCCRIDEDFENILPNLNNLIYSSPNNISPNFLLKLKTVSNLIENPTLNTYNPIRGNRLNEELTEIQVLMPMFGR